MTTVRPIATCRAKSPWGAGDVLLGEIGGAQFFISTSQYETWKHTQLIIDVIDGHGGTFSLEGPEGKAFHTRSRVFTAQQS